jgi:formiminotetrahydrofolate cyclodeaminase
MHLTRATPALILVKNNKSIKANLNSLIQNDTPNFNVIAAKMLGWKIPEYCQMIRFF